MEDTTQVTSDNISSIETEPVPPSGESPAAPAETVEQSVEPIEMTPAADPDVAEPVSAREAVGAVESAETVASERPQSLPGTPTETSVTPVESVAAPEPEQAVEPVTQPFIPISETTASTPSSSRPERRDPSAEPALNQIEGLGMTGEQIVVEKTRELNESEKEQIFKDKLKTLSPRGVSARRAKKQANLDKILAHLRQHGYITNDEVEGLCVVKNTGAWKYLKELERKGLIMRLGARGRGVRYRLTEAISGNIH